MNDSHISSAFEIVAHLATMIKGIVAAIADGDTKRINEIIPPTMRTTLAKHAADVDARMKFGGHDGSE
jgi:hypothetical protein